MENRPPWWQEQSCRYGGLCAFWGHIIGLRQALFPCRPLGRTARDGGYSAQVVEAHIPKNVSVIVFGLGSVTSM